MEKEALTSQVLDALEDVIDPELGIDIVNLGLIYDIDVDDAGNCQINMTLTTPGCPLSDVLDRDIKEHAGAVEGVNQVTVNLVWYPVWTMDKMSRYAKIALGIGGI
ncbi:metal-sulfur cluster assembly factor [Limosilactobacillus ingluviei]|uniref:metal-sulfur cluster assembly factor n=1 Tax=Limosilactobacillus ingluviei TaxID=148604 RepID=UPI0023F0DEB3|nr:metal-sulfur cluster assembly factor [Limosilactobacillus ingluviei]